MKPKFTHICIAMNVYSLLQYLLNTDVDIIKNNTHYFLGGGISKDIVNRMPHSEYFDISKVHGFDMFKRRLKKIILALFSDLKYPDLKTADIFAQDHNYVASCLIGKRKQYTLLSDSQNFFTMQMNPGQHEWEHIESLKKSKKGKIESFLYGPLSIKQFATNSQCKKIMLTAMNKSRILDRVPFEIKSFSDLWKESNNDKKQFICNLFNVGDEDINIIKKSEVLFLTQPFITDGALLENEYNELISKILLNYRNRNVLIKTHPRDKFNYKQYFSEYTVYNKSVPMELLVLLGANVEIAATIFSTSIYCFGDEVQKDWYGTGIHSKLVNFYGKY